MKPMMTCPNGFKLYGELTCDNRKAFDNASLGLCFAVRRSLGYACGLCRVILGCIMARTSVDHSLTFAYRRTTASKKHGKD